MTHDVIIAGAGPVGLFLACELSLAHLSVLVLERVADPDSPLKHRPFGLRGLTVPTLEAFDRRALLDAIVDPHAPRQAGHFAGIPFDYADIDTTHWPWRLPGPADRNAAGEMARIETVLAERAVAQGVDIRRGVELTGITQTDDGVTVHAGDHAFPARWLVGCDGGRSQVRKLSGFEVAGTEPEFTGYSAHVDIADPEVLKPGRTHGPSGLYFQSMPGHLSMAEFDGGAGHRREPVSLDHIQAVLRRLSGTDVTLNRLHAATTWTDRAQQASTYRKGRVLLAGDAAHIHSPLGGQGLNLGLGDALNLGWKLAAVAHGTATDALLDSYTSERHPVGAEVLDRSRAQVQLMRPDAASRALAAILRDVIATRDGATYFAERVWAVSLRYDLGGTHPLVGRSVPEFELAAGRRSGELLRTGRGLLLDFDNRPHLREWVNRWGDRITYAGAGATDRLGLSAVLVRPDGYVAWASDDHAPDGLEAAASLWFGAPAASDRR